MFLHITNIIHFKSLFEVLKVICSRNFTLKFYYKLFYLLYMLLLSVLEYFSICMWHFFFKKKQLIIICCLFILGAWEIYRGRSVISIMIVLLKIPEELTLDYAEITSIPPLPLWTLLAADRETMTSQKTEEVKVICIRNFSKI